MPLSVADVVFGAARELRSHWRALLRALLVPATAIVSIDVAADRLELTGSAWTCAVGVAQIPLHALILIACHRIVLLGDDSLENPWGLHWSVRELRFCLWLTAQALAFASLMGLLLLTPGAFPVFVFPLLFGGVYALSRVSLWLPATAIDENPSFESAWALSRGNGWRLAVALAIVPGLLSAWSLAWKLAVASAIVPDLIAALFAEQATLVTIAHTVWKWLLLVFDVAALSVAFRILSAADAIGAQGAAAGGGGATSASESSSVST